MTATSFVDTNVLLYAASNAVQDLFGQSRAMTKKGEGKMAAKQKIQYVSDEQGNHIGVIIPIELWREIQAERETAYLLQCETMKKRLLKAKNRTEGISLEEAREKLGI